MSHLHIEVDGKAWFDAEVEGWTPPPELPDNPEPMRVDNLPRPVREALAKAMGKAMEQATGFSVTVRA